MFFYLQNIHERHPIALLTGRDMGSILRVQCLIYVVLQSEQWCMQYRGMMDRVLAAPECTCRGFFWFTKYPREALNSSPYRKRYGVYILSSTSAMFSAAIRAMLYAISWYDGPCFGGTLMYVPRFFWFTKYSREALHSSPHMKRYGVDIASTMSDISFVAIRAMLYSISWYDGPCFGGTRMYVPRFFDLQNIHERHSIALPTGRDMGCIIWVQRLLCFLLQSEQWCMQYRGMMGRVLAAPECTCRGFLIYKMFMKDTP